MEKMASTGIKPAPDASPTAIMKTVEYGCEHIQKFMLGGVQVAERLSTAYRDMQDLISRPLEAQATKDPRDPDFQSSTSMRPTFLCLQCSYVCCLAGRDAHYEARKHAFAVESRSGCLYCNMCDDFVYDPAFERLRQQHPGAKKRKLSSFLADDRPALSEPHGLSCRSGAPRGLYNLGQSCYMSVILQAMVHNPFLRNYYLSNRHTISECIIENCIDCTLTASFADILATEKRDGYGPVELLYKSWKSHPGLAGYKQQDAHEYFQFLLDQLHSNSPCSRTPFKDKKCPCLYHRTFFGILRSTVTCLECHNITTADDPIIDLSLDLRHAIKRRKLDAKSSSASEADLPLDLAACLANFTTPERLGMDSYICKSAACDKTPQRARKHLTIKKLPPTLCIQLKRYEHNTITGSAQPKKLDTKINFPLQIDMSPYTTRHLRQKEKARAKANAEAKSTQTSPSQQRADTFTFPVWYDLSSVVVHIGKMDAGHYIAYCRRDDGLNGEQWFKYDDQKVTIASEREVMAADAYLLFFVVRQLAEDQEKEKEKEKGNEAAVNDDKNGKLDADGKDDAHNIQGKENVQKAHETEAEAEVEAEDKVAEKEKGSNDKKSTNPNDTKAKA